MKLLLDTHIWLWYSLAPERLSGELANSIADPKNELWLSPISVWEAMLLAQRGRLSLEDDLSAWIQSVLQTLEMQEATLNHTIAILSRTIDLPHQDPADRFLAATAIFYDLTLATVDQNLVSSAAVNTIS
ncbi:MAG: type II toxin-antitoxin system VapC family toxin [Phormidesmis sp.]